MPFVYYCPIIGILVGGGAKMGLKAHNKGIDPTFETVSWWPFTNVLNIGNKTQWLKIPLKVSSYNIARKFK